MSGDYVDFWTIQVSLNMVLKILFAFHLIG